MVQVFNIILQKIGKILKENNKVEIKKILTVKT